MISFERYVVESWKGFDMFGNDYYFYECSLNPSFWAGRERDLEEINARAELLGELPIVYFTFDASGFVIQVYFPEENSGEDSVNPPYWAYQGIISRGTKLELKEQD
ncbi:hypothetical protein ABHG04_001663 [Escherichia coli]